MTTRAERAGLVAPPSSVDDLTRLVCDRADRLDIPVATAFTTRQGTQHAGRRQAYRNEVVSVRVADGVGSCAVEPGDIVDTDVYEMVGQPVARALEHPVRALRIAVLDAYLMARRPFHADPAAQPVMVPAGDSLAKSLKRARAVIDLLPAAPGSRVVVIGVVNSLLHVLRERGVSYLACDIKGGRTEWDEPVLTDPWQAVETSDGVLATGMTLGNATFEPLLWRARATGQPLVLFAQTGSAVAREFLGHGLAALSAEPYPFFWLTGGPTTLYQYRQDTT